jgi:hypothetical protein
MTILSNIITPTNLVTATSTTTLTNKTLTAPVFDGSPDSTATTFIGAAGALMDSEVTNLAQIKAFDTADYATAAQGTLADDALPITGGTLTGNITISNASPILYLNETDNGAEHRIISAGGTLYIQAEQAGGVSNTGKLVLSGRNAADLAELSIYAAETIFSVGGVDKMLVDVNGATVTGTVNGRDMAADGTKLNGIETNADVTDTANVTAAGALMDSEVTNLAQVKAFDTSDYATAAQGSTADTALQSGTIGSTVQGYDVDTLKADTADNLTAAFTAAVDDDGTLTTGTYTPTTAAGSNYKKIINGGAFTIAPPALATNTATTLSLFIVNNASAGSVTTSGFTMVNGDAFTTTNGDEFLCRIEVFDISGTEFSLFNVVAMQ